MSEYDSALPVALGPLRWGEVMGAQEAAATSAAGHASTRTEAKVNGWAVPRRVASTSSDASTSYSPSLSSSPTLLPSPEIHMSHSSDGGDVADHYLASETRVFSKRDNGKGKAVARGQEGDYDAVATASPAQPSHGNHDEVDTEEEERRIAEVRFLQRGDA